jgi:hypothetical protein
VRGSVLAVGGHRGLLNQLMGRLTEQLVSQRILPLSNAQAAIWVGTFTQLYGCVTAAAP